MKNQYIKHLVELNFAMMFVSTSGVLGRFISLPSAVTIWWRALLAIFFLGIFIWYKKINLKVASKQDWKTIILSGFFMGAHWVTYFYALKLSSVAIGMLAIFTYPIITVFLEPFFFKTTLNKTHVLLGVLVLFGIYLLSPEMDFSSNHTQGVFMGVLSALFYALRNILTKKKTVSYHGSTLMFYQMIVITLLLWPVLFFFEIEPTSTDWFGLAVLAFLTTAVGHTMFVLSMKHFSIGTVSIISSVQPIYGIIFGMLFLGEIPALTTVFGGLIILTTVVVESIQTGRNK